LPRAKPCVTEQTRGDRQRKGQDGGTARENVTSPILLKVLFATSRLKPSSTRQLQWFKTCEATVTWFQPFTTYQKGKAQLLVSQDLSASVFRLHERTGKTCEMLRAKKQGTTAKTHMSANTPVRKMDYQPIYFGFWCLMINKTELD
jgi:hypothetical protein